MEFRIHRPRPLSLWVVVAGGYFRPILQIAAVPPFVAASQHLLFSVEESFVLFPFWRRSFFLLPSFHQTRVALHGPLLVLGSESNIRESKTSSDCHQCKSAQLQYPCQCDESHSSTVLPMRFKTSSRHTGECRTDGAACVNSRESEARVNALATFRMPICSLSLRIYRCKTLEESDLR